MRKAILRALCECVLFAVRVGACIVLARVSAWAILGGRKTVSLGQSGLAMLLFFAILFAFRVGPSE